MRRALVWDLIGLFLVSVYGAEVCPILEQAGVIHATPSALAAFLGFELAFAPLVPRLLARAAPDARTGRLYVLTLVRHVAIGLTLATYDHTAMHSPWRFSLQVAAAVVAYGHFVGVDLALAQERQLLTTLATTASGTSLAPAARSLVRRLTAFAAASVVLIAVVVTFMILRDLDVLAQSAGGASTRVHEAVSRELALSGLGVIALVLHLIRSFSRNVSLLFGHQTRVLEAVGRGELSTSVPVLTNDEFGLIASQTNHMIEGLRERRRIREALGKVVSPEIVRQLLERDGGLALGGSRSTLTLLFSDIRGFTSWSESIEPEALVHDLNRYFTEMVRIVHEEHGVVDKFIGDGMMAVFGIGGTTNASLHATHAARRMIEAVDALGPSLTRPLRIGVGVHRGEVIAGNIGSPDRLEFTVIGDAVNTAARLESLTSRIGGSILVSAAVLDDLPAEERARWLSRGAHELKGKSAPLEVFAPATD